MLIAYLDVMPAYISSQLFDRERRSLKASTNRANKDYRKSRCAKEREPRTKYKPAELSQSSNLPWPDRSLEDDRTLPLAASPRHFPPRTVRSVAMFLSFTSTRGLKGVKERKHRLLLGTHWYVLTLRRLAVRGRVWGEVLEQGSGGVKPEGSRPFQNWTRDS